MSDSECPTSPDLRFSSQKWCYHHRSTIVSFDAEAETHLLAYDPTNLAHYDDKAAAVSMRSPYTVNIAPWAPRAIILLAVASITTAASAFFVPFSPVQTIPIPLTQQNQHAHRRSSSQQQQITHRTRTTTSTPPQSTKTATRTVTKRWASNMVEDIIVDKENKFDLETALFCGGLAFDAYTEPPANSSRWERGVSFFASFLHKLRSD
jgi:hypothetical protein